MKNKLWIFGMIFLTAFGGCGKHEEAGEKKTEGPRQIHFNEELRESVGITLVQTEKKKLVSSVEVYGMIAQDTENTAHIMVKEAGLLKSLKIKAGDTLLKDAEIGTVLTPDQAEQPVLSPLDGVVITLYAKEGEKVDPLSSLATIANPDLLKAGFDVYEKDLGFVRLDETVLVKTAAYPNEEFDGRVVFVSPRVDEETRTVKIRVDIENNGRRLKFGMSVTGQILQETEEEMAIVPLESLQSLEDSWVVFVEKGMESFEVRRVQKGKESETEVQILSGLSEGETVAVHGSFILKSELLKDQLGEE